MALTSVLCAFALASVALSQPEKIPDVEGLLEFNHIKPKDQYQPAWPETSQEQLVSSLSAKDKYSLTWLLYQLTQKQRNGIDTNVPAGRPEGGEKLESRREAMQVELLQGSSLGSRVRKAGCKVFFWKSWTAC